MDKPMLNSAQLVKHMQEKGIKFEITTTKDARYMLDLSLIHILLKYILANKRSEEK